MPLHRMKFMNIEIDNVTLAEAVDYLMGYMEKREKIYVVTPNVDHMVQLQKNELLQEAYRHSGLIITDGMPLVWVSRLYKTPIRERVCGSDLAPALFEAMGEKGLSVFLLGAMPGVGLRAADELLRRYPGLKIAGVYSPPRGFEQDPEEMKRILDTLNSSGADALAVGLGAPKQEYFMYRNRDKYNIPVSLGIGATIDFLAGEVKRAPVWMQRTGLEWLYRIFQDPKRLWRRYLVEDSAFLRLCFQYRPSKNPPE